MKSRLNRASQFMPFDALKGFKEELRKQETEIEKQKKKEITIDTIKHLENSINSLNKASIVEVIHYHIDDYILTIDKVREVNKVLKVLILNSITISFDNILNIKVL